MSNADIRGRFVWHELMTTDTKAAVAFYPKVTAWKTQAWDKDPSYTLWVSAKGPFGGVRTLPDAARSQGPAWLAYIGTPDVDATLQNAQRLGRARDDGRDRYSRYRPHGGARRSSGCGIRASSSAPRFPAGW